MGGPEANLPAVPGRANAAQLGLSPLNGELFGTAACFDLERSALANPVLLDAIFALSTFEDSGAQAGRGVRRRGELRRPRRRGVRLSRSTSRCSTTTARHPSIHRASRWSPARAQTTGSAISTPPALVQELIKSALVPVIEERLAEARRIANGEWRAEADLGDVGEILSQQERVANGEWRAEADLGDVRAILSRTWRFGIAVWHWRRRSIV